MAKGLNKVLLIGHTGSEPEMNKTTSGMAVLVSNIYESTKRLDKKTGERKEFTQRHRVVFFGALAELANKYLKKGSQICVDGKLHTRSWLDKTGKEQFITEVYAKDLTFLDSHTKDIPEEKGEEQIPLPEEIEETVE